MWTLDNPKASKSLRHRNCVELKDQCKYCRLLFLWIYNWCQKSNVMKTSRCVWIVWWYSKISCFEKTLWRSFSSNKFDLQWMVEYIEYIFTKSVHRNEVLWGRMWSWGVVLALAANDDHDWGLHWRLLDHHDHGDRWFNEVWDGDELFSHRHWFTHHHLGGWME